uniref:Uncharacterized protein n=1 Tax=Chromera velia CCMP2878 TaxID=1169474 RepID=A0A0G4HXU4_9ALVE|eukprot:Cvel_9346.t1-p1 / transcript=Cvel_9346.t1 / gene=Cvel_9346 / organism=Chromera_velia_CCMP2878 / gene_product=hypothetical protein / transcript_product=hypothetical protein / location=Cvel_scaffold536:72185-73039(-) / protein_length=285 / sequence_SO=supercontig / SO=protein_coding / is_pseudo=false
METARLQLSLDALRDGSEHMRKKYTDRLWWKECLSVTKLSCNGNIWRIQTRIGEVLEARRVILATGGEPRVPDELLRRRLEEANIRLLHHDDVVVPARLEDPPQFRKLGVVGGAHSGMLAAMNFLSLKPSASVCVFDRKPKPRFAEERDGWIKYDGTGLKGSVASWTKKMLESHDPCLSFEQISPSDDPIKKLKERKVDAVVFTVGFDKTNQIDVSFQDKTVDLSPSQPHDGRTGRLAPGLHGVGIAFPEYWTDEEAFTEPRVGFVVHFVKHLDRVFRAAIDETL